MKCVFHNEREAEFVCPSCGRPVCGECTVVVGGRNVCRACAYHMQNMPLQRVKNEDGINGFLFFIFLAVPGLRHMYLGFMKRGFQFLLAFFGSIALSLFLGGSLGDVLVPVVFIIWFYSAFDSYHLKRHMDRGEKPEDRPLFDDMGYEEIKSFFTERKKLSGGIIILLGTYMLFKQMLRYGYNLRIPDIVMDIISFGFKIIIPVLLIVGGVRLMMMDAARRADEKEQSVDKIQ